MPRQRFPNMGFLSHALLATAAIAALSLGCDAACAPGAEFDAASGKKCRDYSAMKKQAHIKMSDGHILVRARAAVLRASAIMRAVCTFVFRLRVALIDSVVGINGVSVKSTETCVPRG